MPLGLTGVGGDPWLASVCLGHTHGGHLFFPSGEIPSPAPTTRLFPSDAGPAGCAGTPPSDAGPAGCAGTPPPVASPGCALLSPTPTPPGLGTALVSFIGKEKYPRKYNVYKKEYR